MSAQDCDNEDREEGSEFAKKIALRRRLDRSGSRRSGGRAVGGIGGYRGSNKRYHWVGSDAALS